MQMVGADWIKSDKREDDLAGRPGGLVQVSSAEISNFAFKRKGTKIKVRNKFYCRNMQHKEAANFSSL